MDKPAHQLAILVLEVQQHVLLDPLSDEQVGQQLFPLIQPVPNVWRDSPTFSRLLSGSSAAACRRGWRRGPCRESPIGEWVLHVLLQHLRVVLDQLLEDLHLVQLAEALHLRAELVVMARMRRSLLALLSASIGALCDSMCRLRSSDLVKGFPQARQCSSCTQCSRLL